MRAANAWHRDDTLASRETGAGTTRVEGMEMAGRVSARERVWELAPARAVGTAVAAARVVQALPVPLEDRRGFLRANHQVAFQGFSTAPGLFPGLRCGAGETPGCFRRDQR